MAFRRRGRRRSFGRRRVMRRRGRSGRRGRRYMAIGYRM